MDGPIFDKNVKAIKTMLPTFKFCSMERKVSKYLSTKRRVMTIRT